MWQLFPLHSAEMAMCSHSRTVATIYSLHSCDDCLYAACQYSMWVKGAGVGGRGLDTHGVGRLGQQFVRLSDLQDNMYVLANSEEKSKSTKIMICSLFVCSTPVSSG